MTHKSDFARIRSLSSTTAIFLAVLMLCVAVLFSGAPLNAQVQTGIDGTITDLSGALHSRCGCFRNK